MEQKTSRELWQYCYRQARQINSYLIAAKLEMEDGNTSYGMRLTMEAGELINRAETGYNPSGSVYVYKMSDTVQFDVYTASADRYEFIFPFGDNTPRNKRVDLNRCEWQKQAQFVEQIAELRRDKLDIARALNAMSEEDFFAAYKVIKAVIKSTR